MKMMKDRTWHHAVHQTGIRHGVEDLQMSSGVVDYLNGQYPNWILLLPRSNGEVLIRSRLGTELSEDKKDWSLRLMDELARAFMGTKMAWCVVWAASNKVLLVPRDEDGDINYVVEIKDSWGRILAAPLETQVASALAAELEYRSLLAEVGVTADQMAPLALINPGNSLRH